MCLPKRKIIDIKAKIDKQTGNLTFTAQLDDGSFMIKTAASFIRNTIEVSSNLITKTAVISAIERLNEER